MVKKFPNLQLVTKPEFQSDPALASLDIVNFHDLGGLEQKRVEKIMTALHPGAGLVGVAVFPRAWDLRPVISISAEAESGASIIRFLGPEVTLSVSLLARVTDTIKKLASSKDAACKLLQWGVLEGQLWYRRALVTKTLAQRLLEPEPIPYSDVLDILSKLLTIVHNWHARGIVHGHITPSNIYVAPGSECFLLDPAVALAIVQANSSLGLDEFPKGYSAESFAPESITGESLSYQIDVFGLGRVFWQLMGRVEKGEGDVSNRVSAEDSQALRELVLAMSDENPALRPTIDYAKQQVESRRLALLNNRTEEHRDHSREKLFDDTRRDERRHEQPGRPVQTVKVKKGVRARGSFGDEPIEKERASEPSISQTKEEPGWTAGPSTTEEKFTSAAIDLPNAVSPVANDSEGSISTGPRVWGTDKRRTEELPAEDLEQALKKVREISSLDDSRRETSYDLHALNYDQTLLNPIPPPEEKQASEEEEVEEDFFVPPSRSSKFSPPIIAVGAILVSLLCFFIFTGRAPALWSSLFQGGVTMDEDKMQVAWDSGIPSQMRPVALAAVNEGSDVAERIIITSSKTADKAADVVNYPLLRMAFDTKWEMQLSNTDRKVALTLAMGKLLGKDVPAENVELLSLHPGVILAIVSTIPRPAAIGKIPASVLTKLPPPLSFAFSELVKAHPDLICGDPVVTGLGRFEIRGIGSSSELVQFLEQDTVVRLRALALFASQDRTFARSILDKLLNRPNVKLDHPIIQWGMAVRLTTWQELDSNDQLFILAGIVPPGELKETVFLQMLAHPLPEVRKVALENTLERIPLMHPGKVAVLNILIKNPEILTAKQTLDLAVMLEQPKKASPEMIRSFVSGFTAENTRALRILETLLISTAGEPSATKLDTEISIHLAMVGWEPDVDILRKLVFHPDRHTRLFAYMKVFALNDKSTAKSILTAAREKESIEDFKSRLDLMLTSLSLP